MSRTRIPLAFLLAALLGQAAAATAQPAPPGDVERAKRLAVEYWRHDREPIDRAGLEAALARGDWAWLEQSLAAAQSAYEEARGSESTVNRLFGTFRARGLAPQIARWAEARPSSWAARAAHGASLVTQGWDARGGDLARNTHPDRFAAMGRAFAAAERELVVALAARPRLLPAHLLRIEMARSAGGADAVHRLLAEALRRDPAAYYVRWEALLSLRPRWGGSFEAMEAVAREAQAHLDRNPRLYQLLGAPHAERAARAWGERDYPTARQHWNAALSYGRIREWLENRARLALEHGEPRAALADLDELLGYDPESAWALAFRAEAREDLGDLEGALTDVARAAALSPREAWIASRHGRLLRKRERFAEAATAYERAFRLDPSRTKAARDAAWIYFSELRRSQAARPLVEDWLARAPEDPQAWALYGEVLADLGDAGSRRAFERYLELVDESDLRERERARRIRAWLDSAQAPPANAAP